MSSLLAQHANVTKVVEAGVTKPKRKMATILDTEGKLMTAVASQIWLKIYNRGQARRVKSSQVESSAQHVRPSSAGPDTFGVSLSSGAHSGLVDKVSAGELPEYIVHLSLKLDCHFPKFSCSIELNFFYIFHFACLQFLSKTLSSDCLKPWKYILLNCK